MQRVLKFIIPDYPLQPLLINKGAEILSVGSQGEKMVIWALCDDNYDPVEDTVTYQMEHRTFAVYETGQNCRDVHPDYSVFLGTVQTTRGLVYHIFEILLIPKNGNNTQNPKDQPAG